MNPHSDPSAMASARAPGDVTWLVRQFAADVPSVTHAVVVSLDGLQLAASGTVERDVGDQVAALSAALLSMGTRCGELLIWAPPNT